MVGSVGLVGTFGLGCNVADAALDPSENYKSIESTFATVRLRTKVTKGPGSRSAGIATAYKLIDAPRSAGVR
jgi:hypothetical protein